MKKVLILAWDFPPYQAIGAARPNSWFKNFKKNGLYPVVVTRHWDSDIDYKKSYIKPSKIQETTFEENSFGTLIKTPYKSVLKDRIILKYGYEKYKLIRKFLSFFQLSFSYSFISFSEKVEIYKQSRLYLKKNKVDFILATGEPFINHTFALKLSKEFNIPYAIDYRDGWTTGDFYIKLKGIRKLMNNYFYRYFEKKHLKSAHFVLTSNPFELPKIRELSPKTSYFNVYNGYVESEIEMGNNVDQLADCFRIGYAGTIYPFNRVEDFLQGLKIFIEKNPDSKFKLMLLGIESQPIQLKRIIDYEPVLKPYIESTPRLEKRDLIQWFCKCNSLLIFTNPEIRLLPSKVYEYLPLKRKIIVSINDETDLKDIMEMTDAGYNCNNANEIADSIKEMYQEFLETGKVESDVRNYEQFSRANQAKNLAEIILKSLS